MDEGKQKAEAEGATKDMKPVKVYNWFDYCDWLHFQGRGLSKADIIADGDDNDVEKNEAVLSRTQGMFAEKRGIKMKLVLAFVCLLSVSVCVGQTQNVFKFRNPAGVTSYLFADSFDSTEVSFTTVGTDTTKAFSPYSAMVVLTIIQTWDAYLVWCADTVQKRGFDEYVFDYPAKDSIKVDGKWIGLFSYVMAKPTYYRAPREERPTIYGYIEWLRQKAMSNEKSQ